MLKIHLLVQIKTNWTIHICILPIEKLPIVQYFNKFQSMYAMCYLSRISSNYMVKPFSWVKGNFDLSIIKGFYSNMAAFAQLQEKSISNNFSSPSKPSDTIGFYNFHPKITWTVALFYHFVIWSLSTDHTQKNTSFIVKLTF